MQSIGGALTSILAAACPVGVSVVLVLIAAFQLRRCGTPSIGLHELLRFIGGALNSTCPTVVGVAVTVWAGSAPLAIGWGAEF